MNTSATEMLQVLHDELDLSDRQISEALDVTRGYVLRVRNGHDKGSETFRSSVATLLAHQLGEDEQQDEQYGTVNVTPYVLIGCVMLVGVLIFMLYIAKQKPPGSPTNDEALYQHAGRVHV